VSGCAVEIYHLLHIQLLTPTTIYVLTHKSRHLLTPIKLNHSITLHSHSHSIHYIALLNSSILNILTTSPAPLPPYVFTPPTPFNYPLNHFSTQSLYSLHYILYSISHTVTEIIKSTQSATHSNQSFTYSSTPKTSTSHFNHSFTNNKNLTH